MSSDAGFGDSDGVFDGTLDGHDDIDVPAGVSDLFSHPHRATVWSLVREHGSLSPSALATRLAAREQNTTLADVATSERRRIHVHLHHVHLPKLAAAGFVDWDRETNRVTLAADPPIPHDPLETLLENDASHRSTRLETAPTHDRRRAVLAALRDVDDERGCESERDVESADRTERTVQLPVARLASRVAAAECGVTVDDVSSTTVDGVHVSLHHVHLPAMAADGRLEYDAVDGTVTIAAADLE